jgi:NADPH:quinone reductase-like Zn-dependent oxidoreductase
MDAYHIDRFGSVDGIVLRSSEDPQPGPKDVLMRASSLNYRDLMVLKSGGRGRQSSASCVERWRRRSRGRLAIA